MIQRLLPIYVIDTSSLVGLDGLHGPARPPTFAPEIRLRVWEGLERLGAEGSLKLLTEVKRELKIWNPGALQRLSAFPKHRMPPANRRLYDAFRGIFADAECKRLIGDTRHDKADGWLVAAAKLYGYIVITDELPQEERKRNRGVRIPDVCKRVHVQYTSLTNLALSRGWS